MQILPGVRIVDLSLYFERQGIVVISDTQIGYEEAMNRQGVFLPRFQQKDMEERLGRILLETRPGTVIINGDIKHEFGAILRSEWKNVTRMLEILNRKARIILIRGNHDTMLEPIAKSLGLELQDHFSEAGFYFCHGHEIPKDEEYRRSKVVVIGHEHPALGLREGGRVEKYKCFLKGKHNGKDLLVLPSFNPVTEGTDVLKEKLLSPFLEKGISDFEVYVADRQPLYFGRLGSLA